MGPRKRRRNCLSFAFIGVLPHPRGRSEQVTASAARCDGAVALRRWRCVISVSFDPRRAGSHAVAHPYRSARHGRTRRRSRSGLAVVDLRGPARDTGANRDQPRWPTQTVSADAASTAPHAHANGPTRMQENGCAAGGVSDVIPDAQQSLRPAELLLVVGPSWGLCSQLTMRPGSRRNGRAEAWG